MSPFLLATVLLGLLTLGCATLQAAPPVMVSAYRGVTLLVTATQDGARAVCGRAGVDLARVEGRAFADGNPMGPRVFGCYLAAPQDAMVCAAGDGPCLAHEYAHARQGLVHE